MLKIPKQGITVLSVIIVSLLAGQAMAQSGGFTGLTTNLGSQLSSVSQVVGWLAFLSGFVFGVMGIFKFKAYGLNPQDPQNKPMTGVVLLLVGAAMIAIPTVMGLGVASLFGTSTGTGGLSSIGGDAFKGIGGGTSSTPAPQGK